MADFLYITSTDKALEILKTFNNDKYLFFDTEVSIKNISNQDYKKDKIRLIQIGNQNIIGVFDLFHIKSKEFISELKTLLESKGLIGHNIKFDIKYLYGNFDIFPKIVFDTMIASQLLAKGKKERFNLSSVSFKYLSKGLDKRYQSSDWGLPELTEEQIVYSVDDVKILRELFPILKKKINSIPVKRKSSGLISKVFGIDNPIFSIEMAVVPIIAKLEYYGTPIDEESLKDIRSKVLLEIQKLYIEFKRSYGIDLDSPEQVKSFIKNKLGLDIPDGKIGIKDKILRENSNLKEIKEILDYRRKKFVFDKILELENHLKNGRVYSEFKQISSPTGRIYSHNPNIQNLPDQLKALINSKENKILKADFSQIELRIAAEFIKEEKMINALNKGLDLHRYTASLIFNKDYNAINDRERKIGKSINFGLIYGMTPKGLQEQLNEIGINISVEEAKRFFHNFFKGYPSFQKWHNDIQNKLVKYKSLEVSSLLGRKMRVNKFTDAINYPIQATGSDIFKIALALISAEIDRKNLDCKIINLIHDEIVAEISPKDYEVCKTVIRESMVKAGKLVLKSVPVEVEIK